MEQKTVRITSTELPLTSPDPSPDTKKYKSILFQDFLIIFPHYTSYKKTPQLQVLNLKTHEWSTTTLENAPEILEYSDGYSITKRDWNSFILFGGYKAYISQGGSGGLFGPPPKIVQGICLGFINPKLVDGKVKLEYVPQDTEGAPCVSHHSASWSGYKLWVFGGKNMQEECVNTLYNYNIENNNFTGTRTWELPVIAGSMFAVSLKPSARCRHESLLHGDCLYIYGGTSTSGDVLDDLWCFDRNFMSWGKVQTSLRVSQEPSKVSKELISSSIVYENYLIFGSRVPGTYNVDFYVFAIDAKDNKVALPSKTTIPSDGSTFCLEIYNNQILFGDHSKLYTLSLNGASSSPTLASPTKNIQETTQAPQTQARIIPETYEEQQRRHFEERPFPDIVFKVQGTNIPAHKGFLAIRCPYFQRMFSSGMIEAKSKEIEINDITITSNKSLVMLEWIYCDQVKKMDDQIAQEIFAVADKFSLPDLKKLAEKCLIDHLTVENVVERAELADIYEASNLEKAAVRFIVTNIDTVFEKSDIRKLPDSILLKVCKGGK